MAAYGATAHGAVRTLQAESKRGQKSEAAEELKALKARDNVTNWWPLARVYLVIAVAVTGAIWVIEAARAGDVSWWWTLPSTIAAIIAVISMIFFDFF